LAYCAPIYFPYGIIALTIPDAASDKTLVPLELLMKEFVLLDMPCLFPTCATSTFPLDDILKRFFTLLLVFSLGIFTPYKLGYLIS